jgi:hypothetical protein
MSLFPVIPNTDWTLVAQAAEVASLPQKQAMHTLLTLYYPAWRAYVISKWRMNSERAEEYLQEFLTTKVIGENLIAQVARERGRFRNFIRATLDDFMVSQFRREAAKKRALGKPADSQSAELVVGAEPNPTQAFEMAWAREVIAAAVDAMKRECLTANRPELWGLFETRVLQPALDGSTPPAYDRLVKQFGFGSPAQAVNALTTAKRMFERNLRGVLGSFSEDERDVDDELHELRAVLSEG